MKIIILNEKEYITEMLGTDKIESNKVYVFLSIYARYLYHEKGFRKTKIIAYLNNYMKTNYPDYNAINWISTIEKYAIRAEKYPLCKCRGIWITRNEITTIENLHDKVLERLAFTLLCLAKFNNFKNPQNNNWVNYSNGEVYKMACINTTAYLKDLKYSQLHELQLIDFAKKINNLNIQILFLDNKSKNELFVNDFRRLGYEWKLYHGENYIRCASCNILTKQRSNRTKYCIDCARKSAAKAKYLWDKKNRQNKSEN